MKSRDAVVLLLFGFGFWFAGTLFYRARGPIVFEATALRRWINFVVTPAASAVVCLLLLRMLDLSPQRWAAAGLLIALPGMAGEAVMLSNFAVLMPRMHAASAGRFGALLFVSYGLFLAACEVATLRSLAR